MLDRKVIVKNLEETKERLALKGYDFNTENFLHLENQRKRLQVELETAQQERNENANKIKKAFINKETTAVIDALKEEGKTIGDKITILKNDFGKVADKLEEIYLEMPNLPNENCPIGENETQNKEIKRKCVVPSFDFPIRDHVDLAEILDNEIDFVAGVKLAQSRFTVLKGELANLHNALAQFMLDLHTQYHGYQRVNVPVIVNQKALYGTGQLPKFKEDLFKIEGMEMALIPTAEVPLTNLVANEMLEEKELPIKMTAHSLCFRSEAGSAGRDVRGILRQHQFEKVELVQIVKPENSEEALEEILNNACRVLDLLELPYRVVELCTGDLGFSAQKTYDIEVWVPSQNQYREISSCSNMGDFQARRMNTRFKGKGNRKDLVHTLNGSGLAVGRTLLALLENNQNEDGTINIPKILQPYMKGRLEL